MNLSELLAEVRGDTRTLSSLHCVLMSTAGLRLVNRIMVDYPHYAVLTTDKKMAEIIGKSHDIPVVNTKYLVGRWCSEFGPFDLYLADGTGYSISYPVEVTVGATISWETETPTWPTGQHIMHLILAKVPFKETLAHHLSKAKDAASFESVILAQDAIMIFPEFGEPLVPPEWREDSIFLDHTREQSFNVGDSMIHDIYIVSKDEKLVAIVKETELL